MEDMNLIKSMDIFKHYKGSIMEVDFIATNTETNEEMVIYHHIHEKYEKNWARPVSMWFDEVTTKDGKKTTRFIKLVPIDKSFNKSNIKEYFLSQWIGQDFVSFIDSSRVVVCDILKDPINNEYFIIYRPICGRIKYGISLNDWNADVEDSDGNVGKRFFNLDIDRRMKQG